jgi:hypothetical protein
VPRKNKVSEDVTNQWPGVLDEIDINVVPIQYIKAIEVHFDDDKVWVMDIDHNRLDNNEDMANELEESLEELIEEYQDAIQGINFVVDIPKVKRDITRRTSIFLKKKK